MYLLAESNVVSRYSSCLGLEILTALSFVIRFIMLTILPVGPLQTAVACRGDVKVEISLMILTRSVVGVNCFDPGHSY
jgi:hypothetical protein